LDELVDRVRQHLAGKKVPLLTVDEAIAAEDEQLVEDNVEER